MSTNTQKLEPAFDFNENEASVLLHQAPVEICIEGKSYTGDGEVRLDLFPKANIHVYGHFQGAPANILLETSMGQKEITSLSINQRKIDGFSLGFGGDVSVLPSNIIIKWLPKSEPIIGVGYPATKMKRLVFHLFNFVDLIGTRGSREQSGTVRHAIEHVDLSFDQWKVELKSVVFTKENINYLKKNGGYRLTHVGCIEKDDETSFTGKEAEECLTAFQIFLSFSKGGWCVPVCSVGFDASENRVWQSWSSPREPWYSPLSWFDPHHSTQLASLFPGFMKRWADDNWREALHEIIYWYLNANFNSRGIDAGIILTQAAIERLSYEYSVKERRLLIVNGFKDLWASDRFRLLFSSLGIPLDIPSATPTLQILASSGQRNWKDAPHALTEIRNALVHPEHKHRGKFRNAYFEAWNLGLWYLEMAVLAVCGYSGDYGNRLKQRWVGQVEDVPWQN
jgi:hypothetical protein